MHKFGKECQRSEKNRTECENDWYSVSFRRFKFNLVQCSTNFDKTRNESKKNISILQKLLTDSLTWIVITSNRLNSVGSQNIRIRYKKSIHSLHKVNFWVGKFKIAYWVYFLKNIYLKIYFDLRIIFLYRFNFFWKHLKLHNTDSYYLWKEIKIRVETKAYY